MDDPALMRRSYTSAGLDEHDLATTWHEQLRSWFAEASADPRTVEANAMQVATADAAGRPSVRTVLAREIGAGGLVFYTNYESAKGRDLAANPYAAALFSWLPLERQVRMAGAVTRVSRAETERYFASRPRESQLAAWASAQSTVLASRAELDSAVAAVERRFAGGQVPAPPGWGGYRLRPDAVEFWQGRVNRLHDRLRFREAGETWVVERLAP
jgi:pyridoxamine 5'-phosphate oxidase